MLESGDPAAIGKTRDPISSPPRKKGKSITEMKQPMNTETEANIENSNNNDSSLLALMTSDPSTVQLHDDDDSDAVDEQITNSLDQTAGVKSLYHDEEESENNSSKNSCKSSGSQQLDCSTALLQEDGDDSFRKKNLRTSSGSLSENSSLYDDSDDEQSLGGSAPKEEAERNTPASVPSILIQEESSTLMNDHSSGQLTHPLSDEEDEEYANLRGNDSLPEQTTSQVAPERTNTFGSLPDVQAPRLEGSILKRPSENDEAPRRLNLEVSFDKVHIRRYFMCMGDNPTCSIGAPVSLSWEFDEDDPHDVDTFEYDRGPRRRVRHMVLSFYKRQDILRRAGYSDDEIQAAAKELHKTQRQRSKTQIMLPVRKIEEAFESAGRKFKRFGKAKNNSRRSNNDNSGRARRERRRPSLGADDRSLEPTDNTRRSRNQSTASKSSSQDSKGSKSSQGSGTSQGKKRSPTKSFLLRLGSASEISDASSITSHNE